MIKIKEGKRETGLTLERLILRTLIRCRSHITFTPAVYTGGGKDIHFSAIYDYQMIRK